MSSRVIFANKVLKPVKYTEKFGHTVKKKYPNIRDNTLFVKDGLTVGFYLRELPPALKKVLTIANIELMSPRVPKSKMNRSSGQGIDKKGKIPVSQWSTLLGAAKPRPHMKCNAYGRTCGTHQKEESKNFVKAMLLLAKEGGKLLKEIMPSQYEKQKELVKNNVPEKYQLTELFSSSISNSNIAVTYHQDRGNLSGCLNFIFAKKNHCDGGFLHVPEYDLCIECEDESLLVYPAFANMHGVTPITANMLDGYRNSLVFYTVNGLQKFM
tara:strand:- start:968 stop:1771 length:804 start_codon:yes stop_codon:yes gene_type:complete